MRRHGAVTRTLTLVAVLRLWRQCREAPWHRPTALSGVAVAQALSDRAWLVSGMSLTACRTRLCCVSAAVCVVTASHHPAMPPQVRATYKVPLSALGAETYAAACSSGASGSSVPGVAAGDTCSVLSPGSLGASTLVSMDMRVALRKGVGCGTSCMWCGRCSI